MTGKGLTCNSQVVLDIFIFTENRRPRIWARSSHRYDLTSKL